MARLIDLDLDLPIQDTPVSRFLAWIAGGLVFLAALSLAVALAADAAARRLATEPQRLTVVLPAGAAPAPSAEEAERAVAALKQVGGVAFARLVPPQEVVEPLLGKGADATGLPLPRLIDVAFNPGRTPDLDDLAGRLEALAPGASIEELSPGQGEARTRATAIARLALGAGLLAGLSLLVVIGVATRMGLELHAETVGLLRLMGAPDRYVARQFEHHALGSALRGGLLGFGAALLSVLGFEATGAAFPESPLPRLGLAPLDWLILGCVPVTAGLLTALVARATARWGLRQAR